MDNLEIVTHPRLPEYQCHKIVRAALITGITPEDDTFGADLYLSIPSGPVPAHTVSAHVSAEYLVKHKPQVGGYYVLYSDGYESFSPAEAFEEGYKLLKPGAGIGWAVKQLQQGSKVRRVGWNGKGMFLFLTPSSKFTVNRPPLLGIYPPGTEINYHAHVDIKNADGQIVPWQASQSDLLAIDWELAE